MWPPVHPGGDQGLMDAPATMKDKIVTPGLSRIGASAAHAEAPYARTPFTLGTFHDSISSRPPSGVIR